MYLIFKDRLKNRKIQNWLKYKRLSTLDGIKPNLGNNNVIWQIRSKIK